MNPDYFLNYLKQNNVKTKTVLCNGEKLTKKQIRENFEHIESINNIHGGYLMGSHDPLLYLVCELFDVDIHFNFNGTLIKYTSDDAIDTIKIQSSANHCY